MKEYLSKAKEIFDRLLSMGQAVHQKPDERQEFMDQITQAHRDWQIALNNFNFCVEQDLIDYSIYTIEAAENKYIYFLRKARRDKITNDIYEEISKINSISGGIDDGC